MQDEIGGREVLGVFEVDGNRRSGPSRQRIQI